MIFKALIVVPVAFVLYQFFQDRLTWPFWLSSAHQIEILSRNAQRKHQAMLERQTTTLNATIGAYRARRKREPPDGFDRWYELASDHDAVLIEELWDAIYEDLDQYANISASRLKKHAKLVAEAPSPLINGFFIRDGNVNGNCAVDNHPCLQLQEMIRTVASFLPNMDIPVNGHASPRIVVPYSDRETATTPDSEEPKLDEARLFSVSRKRFATLVKACPPNSLLVKSFKQYMPDEESCGARTFLPFKIEERSAFVDDEETWRDVCQHPELLGLHGALVRPNALDMSRHLLPIFAPARVAGLEIALRLPDAVYWANDPDYSVDIENPVPWRSRQNRITWKGSNTGGGHGPENWSCLHRHRFVALTNATYLRSVLNREQGDWAGVPATVTEDVIRLVEHHVDTGFSAIACRDDRFQSVNQPCSYLDAHFEPVPWETLDTTLATYRYLFDIDGNSFSGRYRTLLLSESVVFKATIFKEWHDSRLIPWLHFVPVSNDFGQDLWNVLRYFLDHEDHGASIAEASRAWGRKVLRREDMELYVLRLLLEWARMVEA